MPRGRPSRSSVYERLETTLTDLRERLGGLPSPLEAHQVWKDIWHLEAHNSTALEGNTLVLREVASLLEEGKAVGAKPLKEYMEVKGYGDAAEWVYSQAHHGVRQPDSELINLSELRSIHYALMGPVWQVAPHPEATDRENPGNFREHDINPFTGGMTPPPWPQVPADVDAWISRTNQMLSCTSSEPIAERFARIHTEFEHIHPFIDGNGRTGRLVLNLVLVRMGYPPVVILKENRADYLTALDRADRGDPGSLGEIIARGMLDNLHRFILPAIAGPARLVPLAALANKEFTVVALRQAAQRGRLEAYQDAHGTWLSSAKAVQDYRRSKGRRN